MLKRKAPRPKVSEVRLQTRALNTVFAKRPKKQAFAILSKRNYIISFQDPENDVTNSEWEHLPLSHL